MALPHVPELHGRIYENSELYDPKKEVQKNQSLNKIIRNYL